MANKRYRSIDEITHNGKPLREILEAHCAWGEAGHKKGQRADLSMAHLGRVDLSGEYLFKADLCSADLRGAELSGANLSNADMNHANLAQALLSGAHMVGTDLRWANMEGARLIGTTLEQSILKATNLRGARITGTLMGGNILADCDLSEVTGLESVYHRAPSSIGVDTILKSHGRIPEVFLKGAGVPDIWITYAKSLVENPIEFYSCFISHSHQDKDFCERLYTDLQAKSVRCWYFPEDAMWGKSVWSEIDSSIRIYDKLVVVCSENSLTSGPVIREIERALQREDQEKKEILFPIRIDNFLFDKWDHPRKADVIAKVVGDFRGWKDHDKYSKNFDKLLKALNRPQADKSR